MQPTSSSSHHGPVLPEKDSDVNWRHAERAMKTYLSALVSGHDVMAQDAPPRPAGESPYAPVLLNAAAREHWLYLKKQHDEFWGAEKKGTSAMMTFCGTNATAQRVLRNFLRQAEIAEDNGNAGRSCWTPPMCLHRKELQDPERNCKHCLNTVGIIKHSSHGRGQEGCFPRA
jgi:hypothetical protein